MKIIHLVNTGEYAGAEKVAIQIIEGCRDDIDFCYVGRTGKIQKIVKDRSIEYYSVNAKSIREIRKLCKDINSDIIHAHDCTAAFFSCIAVGRRIPVIAHLHNNSPGIRHISLKSILLVMIILRCKLVLLVSKAIEEEYIFKRLLKKKSYVIGNPLRLQKEKDSLIAQEKEYDLIFVGRLCSPKNPLQFIQIVYNLKQHMDTIKAVMLGDGDLKEDCLQKIEQLGLQKNMELKGFVSKPEEYYPKAKILCLTSRWEGFGLVIFEAMSNSVPVVSMAVGGTVDLVTEKCGKLTRTEEEMTEEIKKLLSNQDYYLSKANEAYLRAKELDNMEKYMDFMKKIYRNVEGKV